MRRGDESSSQASVCRRREGTARSSPPQIPGRRHRGRRCKSQGGGREPDEEAAMTTAPLSVPFSGPSRSRTCVLRFRRYAPLASPPSRLRSSTTVGATGVRKRAGLLQRPATTRDRSLKGGGLLNRQGSRILENVLVAFHETRPTRCGPSPSRPGSPGASWLPATPDCRRPHALPLRVAAWPRSGDVNMAKTR